MSKVNLMDEFDTDLEPTKILISDNERYLKSAIVLYFTSSVFFTISLIGFFLELDPLTLLFSVLISTFLSQILSIILISILIQYEHTESDSKSPLKVTLNKVDSMYWVLKRFKSENERKMILEEQKKIIEELPELLSKSRKFKAKNID